MAEGRDRVQRWQPALPPVESIEGIERVEFEDEEEEEIIFSEVSEKSAEERSFSDEHRLQEKKKEMQIPYEQRIMNESPPKQPL